MKKFVLALSLAAALAPAVSAQKPGHYGAPFAEAKKVELADAVAKVDSYANEPVRLEGTIKDVCTMKGCWIVLTDGKNEVRVSFKDYGFFVPTDSKGKKAVVEGLVAKKTIPELAAKHYAAESGSPGDADKITGDVVVIGLVATGVDIKE